MIQIIIEITGNQTKSSIDIHHNLDSATALDFAALKAECARKLDTIIPALIVSANAAADTPRAQQ
jgi:dsDNA-specific endonuclease/ATPase MutS2